MSSLSTSLVPETEMETKASSFIHTWQSVEQSVQQKLAQLPKLAEQAGPMALVLNLCHVPVAETTSALEKSTDEAKKNHPGVRTTFLILRMLYPGWSSVAVGSDKEASLQSKSKPGAGAKAQASEVKEKLSYSMGEHVLMHSFDLVNQRGTYTRCGKSEQCMAISPGMVLSTKVWGSKFMGTFKEQRTDVEVFDVALVQFGLKSLQSTALTSGMMLEIKAFNTVLGINASASKLLKSVSVPMSLEEAAISRSRFGDGSYLSSSSSTTHNNNTGGSGDMESEQAEGPKGLQQDMLKGNLSSTVSLIRAVPSQAQGVFALGADDNMRFHINEPIADLPCSGSLLRVYYDPTIFASGSDKDWITKLFNVALVVGAIEIFVIIDTYKTSKQQQSATGGEDDEGPSMDCYARLNASTLISSILAASMVPGSSVQYVQAAFGATTIKHRAAYPSPTNNKLLIAEDLRRMTKKRAIAADSQQPPQAKGSVVYKDSAWESAHAVYVFFEGRLVHYFVVPIASGGTGANGSGIALETVSMAKWSADDIDFGDDGDANANNSDNDTTSITTAATTDSSAGGGGGPAAAKKRKRPAAATAATGGGGDAAEN
jgi:hypothetical protein